MNFLRNIRDFILDIPYLFFMPKYSYTRLHDTVEVVLIREYDDEVILDNCTKRVYHRYEYELRSDISLIKYDTVIPIKSDYLLITANKSDKKRPAFDPSDINHFNLGNEEIV
jgi:hypothetical protein